MNARPKNDHHVIATLEVFLSGDDSRTKRVMTRWYPETAVDLDKVDPGTIPADDENHLLVGFAIKQDDGSYDFTSVARLKASNDNTPKN